MGNSSSTTELPDQGDNIIRTYDEEYDPNPKGFGYELFQRLKGHGNTTAQIEASTGEEDPFPNFRKRCISVAIELRNRGVTSDDIITTCTSNHLDNSVVFFAPLFVGAKVSSLDPNMTLADMKGLLDLTKPKFIFVSEDAEEKVCAILAELNLQSVVVVFGDTTGNISYHKDFLNHLSDEDEQAFVPYQCEDPNETVFIIFSSGSTGVPKGICCSHLASCQTLKFIERFNIGGLSIIYSTLVWASGIYAAITNVVSGMPRLVCSIFEAEKTWRYIDKYQIQYLALAPHDAVTLIKHGNPSGIDSKCVKLVTTAGGSIGLPSIAALRKLFPNALVSCPYGQSEILTQVFSFRPDKIHFLLENPNCAGWPGRGVWYKVVDPVTGDICGPNQPGELRVKTKFQMSGYYKIDSSDSWDEDGYLKTGDVAYYTEDHCFFIVERLKEMLRYKMRAVSPSHLENILMEHRAVKICVVIGIPTDEGDIPLGLVVKKDEVTSEELEGFLADRIAEMNLPRIEVRFVDECDVVKTASGKIRRFLLRKKILGGKFEISGSSIN